MRRNAFTLIELVVSIALFGLITVFLFGAIDELRKQQTFFQKKEVVIERKNQILSLLRTDLDRAQSVTVSTSMSKDFDSVSIAGSNRSLYGIDRPYVVWLVLKSDNTLVRLESSSLITVPIAPEALYSIHSDRIAKQCELFRMYDSPKHRLLYLKFENQAPLIVETTK
ncbi:MAG: prepilin-type N-terminal cleavage/methylation domain-containing protein [Campylobacterales bacterium]|nr:prepilin-type N-terminal cleavage/methylation domain-containing protein [Campylobacterales bacterium]